LSEAARLRGRPTSAARRRAAAGAIETWVPLLLFSPLFGLALDYRAFLLRRIKERHDETGDSREAVARTTRAPPTPAGPP
jgi:uncharacterized membrane protein YdfJ with MMPL/SSD domain